MGWPDLMVVCRRWRDVFVTTPAFWRTIDLGHQIDWTKLCLARSVPSSIDVFTRHEDRCPLGVIFPHARRFRRFFFQTAPGSQLERALSYLFGGGMPLLENLTFKVLQTPHMGDAVDANFTSHRFPSLQALTLQGTAAPRLGDVSFYIQLRQLSLNFCSYNLSFEGFLDALSACVQLEDLALINTLHFLPGGWAHDKAMPRRQPITLPCLRKFKAICHDALHTSRFLAHLYLQPSVVFEIAIDPFRGPLVGGEGNWEPPDIIIDATTIREMLPPNRLATLPLLTVATHVEITDMHSEYCIRCGYGYLVDPRTGSPDSVLKVNTVYIWDDPQDGLLTQGLHDLVECFNRAPLTGLKVHAFQLYATVDIWEAVFLAFPLLEELIFDGTEGASGIFLGLHAASSRTCDESSVACPKLNRVSAGRLCTAAAFEAMRECFQHRADRGARLQVLDLRRDLWPGNTHVTRTWRYMGYISPAPQHMHTSIAAVRAPPRAGPPLDKACKLGTYYFATADTAEWRDAGILAVTLNMYDFEEMEDVLSGL
ncbi:hypothetical protein GSI_03449 [Ganoderma sinense ZZ0214-1]|uniref:F-box domain-containing protein n=1 Tax=Ganoderma sinense ZZ0214-1 TaxID=1077348 RepID=A0A2G8SLN8_9APHY|nr:hypothetical protein GSI_03449 [Ganoderma sinense ZZ0214-1]